MAFRLQSLYAVENMIKPEEVLGELPTTKELYRSTMQIAMPAMTDTVLVGLVSMVDTIMVGVLGKAAIAAVGITNQPKMIMLAAFTALNVGVTAIVARRKGEQNREGANRCLGQALMISVILCALLCTLGFLFARPLLLFAGSQADMIGPATDYFQILVLGVPFTAITLAINAAQRGCGNTRISMQTNLTANLVNMAFNYLLIGGNLGFPAWGVRGAAVATVIGNFVGMVMALLTLRHKHAFLHFSFKDIFCFDKTVLKPIADIGLSAGVEQVFMRIGQFLYIKVVASLGTDSMATHNICISILNISYCFSDGLGIAASSLIGQQLGRKRSDLATLYGKACQRISFVIATCAVCVFLFGGQLLVGLFTPDETVLRMSIPLFWVMAITCPFQYSATIFSASLRGAGDTRFIALIAMFSLGIARPGSSWILAYPCHLGLLGAWLGFLVDQSIRFTASLVRFASGKWRQIKI